MYNRLSETMRTFHRMMTMRKSKRHPPTMASVMTQNGICRLTGPAPTTATNVSTYDANNTALWN